VSPDSFTLIAPLPSVIGDLSANGWRRLHIKFQGFVLEIFLHLLLFDEPYALKCAFIDFLGNCHFRAAGPKNDYGGMAHLDILNCEPPWNQDVKSAFLGGAAKN